MYRICDEECEASSFIICRFIISSCQSLCSHFWAQGPISVEKGCSITSRIVWASTLCQRQLGAMDDLSCEVANFLIGLEDLVRKLRGVATAGEFMKSLEAAKHLVAALQADFSWPASDFLARWFSVCSRCYYL